MRTISTAVFAAMALASCGDNRPATNDPAEVPAVASTPVVAPAATAPAAPGGDRSADLSGLTADDQRRPSTGAHYDTVDYTVSAGGQRLGIEYVATGYLPRLEVMTASQETLYEAEALSAGGDGSATASLEETLPEGRYILVFTSTQPGVTGPYRVDLSEVTLTPLN